MEDFETTSLGLMLERDLQRIGMKQKELVAKLTDEGEPALTQQGFSNWKRSGKVPRRRLAKMLEILGPDSELAKAHAAGQFGGNHPDVADFQEQAPDPHSRKAIKIEAIGSLVKAADDLLRPQFAGVPAGRESTKWEGVRDRLPAELIANCDRAVKLGALNFYFDYMSNNAVVEIKMSAHQNSGSIAPHVYRSLYRLALLEKLYGAGFKRRVYGLLLVGADADSPGIERAKLEASLMGIQLRAVATVEQAVKTLLTWEKGPQDDLFS